MNSIDQINAKLERAKILASLKIVKLRMLEGEDFIFKSAMHLKQGDLDYKHLYKHEFYTVHKEVSVNHNLTCTGFNISSFTNTRIKGYTFFFKKKLTVNFHLSDVVFYSDIENKIKQAKKESK